ncbi:MAG: flagellar export chaperone FliS [Nitrospirota bacterium]
MSGPSHPFEATLPAWWEPACPTDAAVGASDRMVLVLYAEALTRVRMARTVPRPASRDVQTVLGILAELSNALAIRDDRDAVGDLLSLYYYMTHRLTTAGHDTIACALAEVERLFVTLQDGWIQVLQADSLGGFPDAWESDDARPASAATVLPP